MRVPVRLSLIFFFLLLTLVVVSSRYYQHVFMTPLSAPRTTTLVIPPGGHAFNQLQRQLSRTFTVRHRFVFALALRFSVNPRKLVAGEYKIKPGVTLAQLLLDIEQGKVRGRRFSIVAGLRLQTVLARMYASPYFKHTAFSKKQVAKALGIKQSNPEGEFLPATYDYHRGDSILRVLRPAHQEMTRFLTAQWAKRAPNLWYKTAYQALITASMIEKETHVAAERPMVAAVILNRLAKRMRLQIDPTVLYGSEDPSAVVVTGSMLATKTPYNTYRQRGLPPTPIALPSRASIIAALHPAKTKALFYVAVGDGKHHRFSETYKEHLKSVKRYRQKLRIAKAKRSLNSVISTDAIPAYWAEHCQAIYRILPLLVDSDNLLGGWGQLLFLPPSDVDCHRTASMTKHKR